MLKIFVVRGDTPFTEIKPGGPAFLGILEANDGISWFGALGLESGVHRYDGTTIAHFMSKERRNNKYYRF